MAERAKQILKQLLAIWNKYTSKQKTVIISAVCVIIFALSLLVFLMQRTTYDKLTVAESPQDASTITKLLEGDGIAYKTGKDNLTIYVDAKKSADALYLLADNNMPSNGLTVDDLFNNSLSTTNYDRTLKINLFFQNQVTKRIMKIEGVKDAEVDYIPDSSSGSIFGDTKETSASVFLTVQDDFDTKKAKTIAVMVASVIGNTTPDTIKVADQFGNLLYGGEEDLYSGSISGKEDYEERLTNNTINRLYALLIKSGYNDATISPNLSFNMDVVSTLMTEYTVPAGLDQGYLQKSYTYNSVNANTSGGVPGTTSNDSTSYVAQDTAASNGTVDITENSYLPNTIATNTQKEIGAIQKDASSMAIVLTRVKTVKEADLKAQGLLQGITFDQYVSQNSALVSIVPEPSLFDLVAAGTGIAAKNITIIAWEQPVYVPTTVTTKSWTDYLQIILAVLIVALLVFVVFRGVKPVDVTELEPELSVEQLLATTKENQTIEDIEFNEVSEVRRMIEKFVDEKPEAVAQLLRNWLNEDWS